MKTSLAIAYDRTKASSPRNNAKIETFSPEIFPDVFKREGHSPNMSPENDSIRDAYIKMAAWGNGCYR